MIETAELPKDALRRDRAAALPEAPADGEFPSSHDASADTMSAEPQLEAPRPRDWALQVPLPAESAAKRWACLAVALAVTALFWFALQSYWSPAHPGIDQNGYLHGGRVFSQTLSTGFKPDNPFQYVGGMWVMTDDGWVYPKYPLGVPVLVAIGMWIGGETTGPTLAHLVSPACAAVAVIGMFLLARTIAGSFAGLLAQLLLATNPILWAMTNNPWSHAPSLAFATCGMAMLLWWWRDDRDGIATIARGVAAGFLLGYAVTVRYTEGLLLLPMAVAILSKLRWADLRSWARCAAPAVGWLIPVVYLLAFNRLAMGTWTGYDTTNESTGFQLAEVADKWPIMLDVLYGTGLYFVLPIGLFGLLLLPRRNWRLGLFLLAWFVPGVLVYTSYYWGENAGGMGYARFFLSLLPPVIAAAAWVLATGIREMAAPAGDAPADAARPGSVVAPLAAAVIVGIACVANVRSAVPAVEREAIHAANLADTTAVLKLYTRQTPPSDVVLFAEGTGGGPVRNYLNHLQFATGFEIYSANAFTMLGQAFLRAPGPRDGGGGADAPSPMQAKRREYLQAAYAKFSDDDLIKQQNAIMRLALAKGRRVLALLPATEADRFERRYVGENFAVRTLAAWREPVKWQEPPLPAGPDRRGGGGGATRRPAGPPGLGGPFAPAPGGGAPGQPQGGAWNRAPSPQSMRLIEVVRK